MQTQAAFFEYHLDDTHILGISKLCRTILSINSTSDAVRQLAQQSFSTTDPQLMDLVKQRITTATTPKPTVNGRVSPMKIDESRVSSPSPRTLATTTATATATASTIPLTPASTPTTTPAVTTVES